jgi:hypothetical protein
MTDVAIAAYHTAADIQSRRADQGAKDRSTSGVISAIGSAIWYMERLKISRTAAPASASLPVRSDCRTCLISRPAAMRYAMMAA